jgi:hypothetical protein
MMSWVDIFRALELTNEGIEKENKALKEAVCFLCWALVACESEIIDFSRMNKDDCFEAIQRHKPLIIGIKSNLLVTKLAKYAPNRISSGVLQSTLYACERSEAEKEKK